MTTASNRQVPMLDFVKEAFIMEKEVQELLDIKCEAVIDGYTDLYSLTDSVMFSIRVLVI